jgi:hypothetical protein
MNHKNQLILTTALVTFLLLSVQIMRAEGTKELSPTASDSVMLHTNASGFGNFASYASFGTTSALLVRVEDFTCDTVFIGLSFEHNDFGGIEGAGTYSFRILDPTGAVAFGPFTIGPANDNATSWSLAANGPDVLGMGGYSTNTALFPYSRFVPTMNGDYTIQFDDGAANNIVNIMWFDFTVRCDGEVMPGRLWSRNWALRTPPINPNQLPECQFDRDFNGVFYSYTMDGFVSRIDFDSSGFQGLSFTVAFGDTGPGNTGDVISDRRSVNDMNATANAADHMVFLNNPDTTQFPSDTSQCGSVALLSVSCEAVDSFCINVGVTEAGQVEIILDFVQNGIYDADTTDVLLAMIFPAADTVCIPWDGLKGDGSMIAFGEDVPTVIRYSQGVQHYAAFDVEFLKNGFCVQTVRPLCPGIATDLLYWDDSQITDDVVTVTIDEGDPGTGQPKVQLNGCTCGVGGCRTWDNFQIGDPPAMDCTGTPYGYGENSTLNTWWYASTIVIDGISLPFAQVNITGDSAICEGTMTEFTAETAPDSVMYDFQWSGPGGFMATTQSTGPISTPGTYFVTITDPLTDCSAIDSAELIVFENPTTSITFDCVSPNDPNANVNLTVSGGNPPYIYLWSNGAMTEDLVNVPPGEYSVIVTDENGCQAFDTVVVAGCCELDIICPPSNGQYACIDDVPPLDSNGIVVIEYCDDFSIVSSEMDNGGAGCPGDTLIITRTHVVTDLAGNVATCTQVLVVVDDVAPTLVTPVGDTSLICGSSVSPDVTGIPVYMDNCSDVTISFEDDSTGFDGTCTNNVLGTITRTFSAVDACGNVNGLDIQIINIIDTIPPTFTTPVNVTIDCAADISPVNTGEVTDEADNCMGPVDVSFSDFVVPGVCPASDTVFRTWVAADICGNSSSGIQVLVLLDTVPPTFTVPDTAQLDCGGDTDPSNTGTITDAVDNCSSFTITFSDVIVEDGCPVNDTVFRTWVVEDACGNSASGVQVILRLDTIAPSFTTPADTILDCGMSTDTSITGSIIDATDNCSDVTISFEDEFVAGVCPGIDTTFRTWTVVDNCFNSATGVQTIIRVDTLPPAITCPANVTVDCASASDPQALGMATATDACDPAVIITFDDTALPESCTNDMPLFRTWIATDVCGNSSTCVQEITLLDTVPPSFITPDDITLSCEQAITTDITGTPVEATDNCSTPEVTFVDSVLAGSCAPTADITLRTWIVTDICGNSSTDVQTITRIDTVPPTFTLPANTTISCTQDSLPMTTGQVTDTLDNCSFITVDFTDNILPNGCPVQDTIERTWIVSDLCGNSSTGVQLIIRLDQDAPTFTVPADTIVDCGTDTSPATTGDVTDAMDVCSDVTISFDDVTISGVCPVLYTINRTWTVQDECNNSATGVQVITVQDTTSPTFVTPPSVTIDCDDDIDDLTLTGNVSDVEDCSSIADTTYSDMVALDGCDGTAIIVRTFVVSDLCGNSSSGTQTLTIQDTLSPMITVPADITIECDQNPQDTSITGGMIVFFDNCSMMFMASFTDDTSGLTGCNGTGTILRLWLVDDECDNSATMTQVITIEDNTPPEAICQDFMIDFGDETTVTILPEDIDNGSSDNCGPVTLSLSQTEFNCDEFIGQMSVPVILTVTDECGNSSTCQANVTGIGGALEIDCPDDIIVYLGPGECSAFVNYTVTAEAICGGTDVVITQIDNSGLTSGDAFPIGVTIQTYQATNGVDTAVCSFTITVIEADIPVILACNDTVNVSVDANCEAHIFADMILEGDNYTCFDDFIITIENYGTDTGWIVVVGLPLNECYTVTITDPETGNSCWGTLCLEDKIPPQIICACPPGAGGDTCVVSCLDVDQLLDGNIPPNLQPEVIENCGVFEVGIADITVDDAGCGEGGITITWIVTDQNGLTATCVQEFDIEPLSIDSIVFPPNYEGDCGTSSDPDVTGWPQVNGIDLTDEAGLCNLFLGYWDKALNDCGGGVKILRTWTVLDWCTLELVEATQIIKLSDDEGPVLTCPSNITVGTDFWYCYANVSVPRPIAYDECSDVVSFELSVNGGGLIVQYGNNYVIQELPLGTYTAVWTVTDLCGNSSTCSFTITVVDDVVPVANCDHHTIVSLTNDGPNGITLVPASVFDDGSYDNCGPVTFRARRMTSCIDIDWTTNGACEDHIPNGLVNSLDLGTVHRTCVPFACCDVPRAGSRQAPIMVELEVTDLAGNKNYCMVEVEVQDKLAPFIECPPDIIVSCDYWFPVEEGTFRDAAGNHNGNLDEDPLSHIFGNMFDALTYNDDESVRQPIIINDPGNDQYSQPHFWGIDGWADDNCYADLEVRVRVIDDCSGGDLPANAPPGAVKVIERRFTAKDFQGFAPSVCTQRIWVVDFDPFYITDVNCNNNNPNDGVIWPCDLLITDCPENLDNLPGPVIFDDACSLIGVAFEDTRFDFVDGACFKILRRWAVIDWCQYDPVTGEGLWYYTQVIKVHDEEGPEFTECPSGPVVLCVADDGVTLPDNNQAFLGESDPLSSSCSAHLNLCQVVHETCSDYIKFDVKIYLFNSHEFIQVAPVTTVPVDSNNHATLCFDTHQSSIQSVRLNGIPYNSPWCGNYHRILWSVEDGCGNWSHCEYLFRLEDCKQPSPVCINGLSTVVMPIGCEVTLWAKDFDASSFDDCTPAEELLFSFSGDFYEPSRAFNNDNIPAFGVELSIPIWVADGGNDDNCDGQISWDERNKDFCTTTVIFTDNSGNCGGTGSILYEGQILTEHEDAVESVQVSLKKDTETVYSMTTIENGRFILVVPQVDGQRYKVEPKRNDQHRNGVSTLDLVEIQKHLLGKEFFDSPYQYIAADATNNQQVSAIDLIEIRKLILGIYTEFPNNQSWRFVEKSAVIHNPTHPWPFVEVIDIQYDGTSHPDMDFIGVKIGDVNNTVQANATQILPRDGRRIVHVKAEATPASYAGELVNVTLTIPESLVGFQWTLETKGLEYAGITSEDILITDENVGLLNDGIITMSWNHDGSTPLNGKDLTIHLQFKAMQAGDVLEWITMNSKITSAEAYSLTEEILDVKLETRTEAVDVEFALYQNEPNPWNSSTVIRFDLPEPEMVKLTLFDLTGKQVKVIERACEAGSNMIALDKKEISAHGVLYYRLDSGRYSATKKMMKIE